MTLDDARILYYGSAGYGTTSLSRLEALKQLCPNVYAVDSRIYEGDYLFRSLMTRAARRLIPQVFQRRIGTALVRECNRYRPNVVWVDQGWLVPAWALKAAKQRHGAVIVHYTPDSLRAAGTDGPLFRKAIKEFDCCVTTKEHEVERYRELGAATTLYTLPGVDPKVFRKIELNPEDVARYACDVVFVGQDMRDRRQWLSALRRSLSADIRTYGRIKGDNRGERWLFGDEYVKALSASKIALCFLNNEVGDRVTTRTFEIPASGVFMLAQRTDLHKSLFREDVEAAYFDGPQELIDKVKYYLAAVEERQRIAEAGYRRCRELRCSWADRLTDVLSRFLMVGTNPRLSGRR